MECLMMSTIDGGHYQPQIPSVRAASADGYDHLPRRFALAVIIMDGSQGRLQLNQMLKRRLEGKAATLVIGYKSRITTLLLLDQVHARRWC
ncbi:hypothetical protein DC366_08235 [Pelagivirga sediminicola]|uniref:Uncharacterized protein n=1 Tax=Pelagivirga sediminicola TaxID=2170575 RepID=A0A2T7G8T8_9RHOB|nr:hypothetical protein DC366_08235 [Pelagivirga sediminicola]